MTGLVTFADHRAFNDMSQSMGSSDWPEVTHQIATIVACGVLAIGAVSFMFARRRHSASHVLRALFGCFCIGAAFVCMWVGVEGVDWQDAYMFSSSGAPLLAIKESFLDDDMLASCVGGGITCLAGASILAWPARKQPSASIEEKQS